MAIREDSHQRCSLAVRTPMAAAAISVQMIATCPRPMDCSGISAPIIKPAAGTSVAHGPQGATRRSATSPDGSKMWLAMMCCTSMWPLGHHLCCMAIGRASPVKGPGATPMLPTPRPVGKGKDKFSLPVEDRAAQGQYSL